MKFVSIFLLWILCKCEDNTEYHHTSCLHLDDGLHYIRPISNPKYPSILVRCSSGWTILDYSLDNNIRKYFTSFMAMTDNFASMDVGLEHMNWKQWLNIPNNIFTTSSDCNQCNTDVKDINTAYYMTGNYYGCSFATKALCDMDHNTLQCYQCTLDADDNNNEYPGLCTHIILNIDNVDINNEDTSHKKCVTYKWNYLPSIGLHGEYCTCIKPIHSDNDFLVDPLYDHPDQDIVVNVADPDPDPDCSQIHSLTNDDFKYGTLRIRKCGIYKLTENILLNMNAPISMDDIDDINSINNNYWWPQSADSVEYPSSNFIGAYSMGFFSGISIEIDNVIIDLNNFEFRMSNEFYIQQRFFSLIELGSQPFISGQGPTNFGNINIYPSGIEIRNGILSLTSHHCIHGNNNKYININNIKFRDFEVSAISINGFDTLTIQNIEIGSNYQNIPITPQYSHARFMLKRLQLIHENDYDNDKYVIINRERYNANDIIDDLQDEMNAAFQFSMNDEDIDIDIDDNNLYINNDGLPHGATLYGIFLNSEGASVFGLGLSPGYSSSVYLKNINIHDLRSNPQETVRLPLQRGPFNDLLDIKRIMDDDNVYSGTTYSNAQYMLNQLIPSSSWSILGHTYINKHVELWISGTKELDSESTTFKCNSDIMLHLSKGIFGIRMDNIHNINIDGYLHIENLHNLGEFGESTLCGKYYSSRNGGHHNQQYPQQIGYTGSEVHGISFINSIASINDNSNIFINDLISARGSVYGINFYPGNDIKIGKNVQIEINNVHSGAYLNKNDVSILSEELVPNTVPRSCVIDLWKDSNYIQFEQEETVNIKSKCITGYDECSFKYSKIDNKYKKEDINDILNVEYLMDYIDNGCEYKQLDGETVLHSLSKTSKYHLKSLQLLSLQTKGDNKPEEQTINIESNHNQANIISKYLYVIVGILISLGILLMFAISKYSSKTEMKDDKIVEEEHPLISIVDE